MALEVKAKSDMLQCWCFWFIFPYVNAYSVLFCCSLLRTSTTWWWTKWLTACKKHNSLTLPFFLVVSWYQDVNIKIVILRVTSETGTTDRISLEKNGIALGFFPGEVSSDRISAIEVWYIRKTLCVLKYSSLWYFLSDAETGSLQEYGISALRSRWNWLHWPWRSMVLNQRYKIFFVTVYSYLIIFIWF